MACVRIGASILVLVLAAACGDSPDCHDGDLYLLVEPLSLSLPAVCPGQSSSLDVTATNASACTAVELRSAELNEVGGEFSLTFTPVVLQPGQTMVVAEITFSALESGGVREGTLTIQHDVPEQMYRTTIPVSAQSMPSAVIVASPSPIDFGFVSQGESKNLDVRLTNPGCDSITVREVYLGLESDPGFTVEELQLPANQYLPVTLARGDELGVALRLQPNVCGEASSSLNVGGRLLGADASWSVNLVGHSDPCTP
ncbi:MAG TPA: hypothetical protein PLQ97_14500 [Myxococcota bacterium]|nr:hypothetical protein [Myxococcota bacterium]HQK49902.1 hypothetical protein [Myxococcota bacterium]